MSFLLTWLTTAIAAAFAVWIVPGLEPVGGTITSVAFFALAISLVNAIVRPVLQVISFPITVITLGIFHFVINALALNIASWLSLNLFNAGVYVVDFWAALWGSIVISIASSIVGAIVGVER